MRVAGQFEKLACVYLALSDFDPVNPKKVKSNLKTVWSVQSEMIKSISPYVRPVVICSSEKQLKEFTEKQEFKELYYYIIPHDDIWIRDSGVEWVINEKEQIMVNHNFGLWGYINTKITGDWAKFDNPSNIPGKLSKILSQKLVEFPEWYKGEGGNRSFNGKGTLICNIGCELQRNPGKKIEEIEKELYKIFNLKKIIWLPIGVADDDLSFQGPKMYHNGIPCYTMIATGGHVDEFCRFINSNTVVLSGLGNIKKYSYLPSNLTIETENRMSLVESVLKNETDQDGNPLNIIRIPIPECDLVELDKDDETYQTLGQLYDHLEDKIYGIPASSYGNFLLANDSIVVSQYSIGNEEDKKLKETDEMVIEIFKKHFKNVIGINNLALNCGGGGFNCTTCDQPLEGLKEIPGILYKKE